MKSLKIICLTLAMSCACSLMGQTLIQPVLTTLVPNSISTASNPDLYEVGVAQTAELWIDAGDFGDSLVSMDFQIKKDGQLVSNIADYGYLRISVPAMASGSFRDTTYGIATASDCIPGPNYGYGAYSFDGLTLGLLSGKKLTLTFQWNTPGVYTIEWNLVRRVLTSSSNRIPVNGGAVCRNTSAGNVLLSDVMTMNVKQLEIPSVKTSIRNDIATADHPYLVKATAMDTNVVDLQIDPKDFAGVLTSLSYVICKDGTPIRGSLSGSGRVGVRIPSVPGSFIKDTVYVLTDGEGVIPGSSYGYGSHAKDGITLGLLAGSGLEIQANWYEPGLYTICWSLVRRVLDSNSIVVRALDGAYCDLTKEGDVILTDTLTMEVLLPDFELDYSSPMAAGITHDNKLSLYGNSYVMRPASLGYQIQYAADSVNYIDITDNMADYGSVSVFGLSSTGDTLYSGELGAARVIPPTGSLNLGLLETLDIHALTTWLKPGRYMLVFNTNAYGTSMDYKNNMPEVLRRDTLLIDVLVYDFLSICSCELPYEYADGLYIPLSLMSDAPAGVSVSDTLAYSVESVSGADSIVNLIVTVHPTYELIYPMDTVCVGNYKDKGFDTTFTDPGFYQLMFKGKSMYDCDSTVRVVVFVAPKYYTHVDDDVCAGERYNKNGIDSVFNTAGTYVMSQKLVSIYGCDSVIDLSLTVYPKYPATRLYASVCRGERYVDNGFNIYTRDSVRGVYNYQMHMQSVTGCDSLIYLQLTVNDTVMTQFNASICLGDRYAGNGFNLQPSAAGVYHFSNVRKSAAGCDSTAVLTLTVNQTYANVFYDEVCAGERYRKFGFDTLVSVNNTRLVRHAYTTTHCDSLITVILTVHPQASSTLNDYVCRSEGRYVKNGFSFALDATASSMVERMVYHTAFGCDSIVTLYLTINDGADTSIFAELCEGERYAAFGLDTTIYDAGTYKFSRKLFATNGCDSSVFITLVVKPTYITNEYVTLCEGDSVAYNGVSYGTSGTYKIVYPATNTRCDSVLYLTITVSPIVRDSFNVNLCRSSQPSYMFGSRMLTQDGVYYDTTALNGCYRIAVLNLVFSDTVSRPLSIQGETNIYTAGNYTYYVDTVPGADSYLWETSDVTWTISANMETAVISIPTPGSGLIMCSCVNACGVSSKQSLQVFSAVDVAEADAKEVSVSVFPNPTHSDFTLTMKGFEGRVQVRIMDVTGKVIFTDDVEASSMNESYRYSVADYPKGVYLVGVTGEKTSAVEKLIVR